MPAAGAASIAVGIKMDKTKDRDTFICAYCKGVFPVLRNPRITCSMRCKMADLAKNRPSRYGVALKTFWERVRKTDSCWIWTGGRDGRGYGRIGPVGALKEDYAHRHSYRIHKGEIPHGLAIDHLCQNKWCVNPNHLEAVTQTENTRRWRVTVSACKRGHQRTKENTYTRPSNGSTSCIPCIKLRRLCYSVGARLQP